MLRHGACLMQRYRWFTELLSSLGCCMLGFYHCHLPVTHRGMSTPWCASRIPLCGWTDSRPAGRRLGRPGGPAVPPSPPWQLPRSTTTATQPPYLLICLARSTTRLLTYLQTKLHYFSKIVTDLLIHNLLYHQSIAYFLSWLLRFIIPFNKRTWWWRIMTMSFISCQFILSCVSNTIKPYCADENHDDSISDWTVLAIHSSVAEILCSQSICVLQYNILLQTFIAFKIFFMHNLHQTQPSVIITCSLFTDNELVEKVRTEFSNCHVHIQLDINRYGTSISSRRFLFQTSLERLFPLFSVHRI